MFHSHIRVLPTRVLRTYEADERPPILGIYINPRWFGKADMLLLTLSRYNHLTVSVEGGTRVEHLGLLVDDALLQSFSTWNAFLPPGAPNLGANQPTWITLLGQMIPHIREISIVTRRYSPDLDQRPFLMPDMRFKWQYTGLVANLPGTWRIGYVVDEQTGENITLQRCYDVQIRNVVTHLSNWMQTAAGNQPG